MKAAAIGAAPAGTRRPSTATNGSVESSRHSATSSPPTSISGSVMNLICERTQELTGADSGSILMLDGDDLVHRAATGFVSRFIGERVSLEGTFSGSVYRNNRSAICADTKAMGNGLAYRRGIRSLIAVPLRHREEAVGLLTVLSRTPNAFTTEDLNTLELLAVVLASVMSHASEFEALAGSGRSSRRRPSASCGSIATDASSKRTPRWRRCSATRRPSWPR